MNNANEILARVNNFIEELENANSQGYLGEGMLYQGYASDRKCYLIDAVYEQLSIFDWWSDKLSLSKLKQMKKFLDQAIKLGFTGYVCFKVGVKGCANGMWAYKAESTTGSSPEGDVLYHSFVSGTNYYDVKVNDTWYGDGLKWAELSKTTVKQIEEFLKSA